MVELQLIAFLFCLFLTDILQVDIAFLCATCVLIILAGVAARKSPFSFDDLIFSIEFIICQIQSPLSSVNGFKICIILKKLSGV